MPRPSERFEWLAEQLDTLLTVFNHTTDSQERRQLLRRMKVLIDEIDALIVFSSKREKQDIGHGSQPQDSRPE
jgi:hypothetical protein